MSVRAKIDGCYIVAVTPDEVSLHDDPARATTWPDEVTARVALGWAVGRLVGWGKLEFEQCESS